MPQAPSLFRRLQSYLMDVVVEEGTSNHNPELRVILREGQLELQASTVLYSRGHRYGSFRTAFKQLSIKTNPPAKVLLLGLGLGSIPMILEKCHGLHPSYTGIEIDPAVVQLFDRWFPKHLRSFVEVHTIDACRWVEKNGPPAVFDLICVDLFEDRYVPECAEQTVFIDRLKQLCNTGGQILFSRLNGSASEHRANLQFLEKFKQFFGHVHLIQSRGNDMIWAHTPR